mgnify:CR=1 FL=1
MASLYYLYFSRRMDFAESWAVAYLIFVALLTLEMQLGLIPNPELDTGLYNRLTGEPLIVRLSHLLWLSVSLKLLLVGVNKL